LHDFQRVLIELFTLTLSSTVSHRALDEAVAALADFRPQEAIVLLERAAAEGPYDWRHHVLLEEQIGIANAYLGRNDAALAAFERLLALDPGHAVSYTLSPKVTFVFERARERARSQPAPAIEISWPQGSTVSDPIPIEIEVASDPQRWFTRGTVHYRTRGDTNAYTPLELALHPSGKRSHLTIPAVGGEREASLELYFVARDARGNETYLWHSPAHPRDIALTYEPREAWYAEWWLWAIVGGAVAAAGVGAALIATHEPDRETQGTFSVRVR
jgi:tetratricopeptide (TPR) repeat protein